MVENAPQLLPSLVALFAGAAALWLLRRLPLSSIAADLELVPALVAVIVGALTFGLLRRKRPAETATAARRGPPAEEPPPTPPARPPLPEPTADLERIAECVVCLEQIERSALGSCPHHFCVACLLECCRLTPRCPKCSTKIEAVWLDTDFDVLLRHARASEPPADALARREACEAALRPYVVHLRLPKGACAGVTLRGCPGRPGVAVALALERDMAYRCGLRVGDLLVSMNGVPCRTHQQCVETIDRLSESASTDEEILCLVVPGGAAQPLPTPPDDDDAADDAARVEALGEADEDGGGGGCAIL